MAQPNSMVRIKSVAGEMLNSSYEYENYHKTERDDKIITTDRF